MLKSSYSHCMIIAHAYESVFTLQHCHIHAEGMVYESCKYSIRYNFCSVVHIITALHLLWPISALIKCSSDIFIIECTTSQWQYVLYLNRRPMQLHTHVSSYYQHTHSWQTSLDSVTQTHWALMGTLEMWSFASDAIVRDSNKIKRLCIALTAEFQQ